MSGHKQAHLWSLHCQILSSGSIWLSPPPTHNLQSVRAHCGGSYTENPGGEALVLASGISAPLLSCHGGMEPSMAGLLGLLFLSPQSHNVESSSQGDPRRLRAFAIPLPQMEVTPWTVGSVVYWASPFVLGNVSRAPQHLPCLRQPDLALRAVRPELYDPGSLLTFLGPPIFSRDLP